MIQYYAVPAFLAVSTVVSLIILARKRHINYSHGLFIYSASTLLLAAMNVSALVSDLPASNAWLLSLGYLGLLFTPAGIVIFFVELTRRSHLLRLKSPIWLLLLPFALQIIIWTDSWHALFFQRGAGEDALSLYPCAFFQTLISVYVSASMMAGLFILLHAFVRSPIPYRRQAGVSMIGVGVSSVFLLSYFNSPSVLPPSPFFLLVCTITGFSIGHCIYHDHLFLISPFSRKSIVDNLSDGVIVLDNDNQIIDINPAAESIIGPRNRVVGQPINSFISKWDNLTGNGDANELELRMVDRESKYYNIHISKIYDQRRQDLGKIITWRDITEHKRLDESRQSEQEMFALIQSISDAASQSTDWKGFLTQTMYQIVYTFRSQAAVIYCFEQDNEIENPKISLITQHGPSFESQGEFPALLESKQLISDVLRTKKTILIPDRNIKEDLLLFIKEMGYISLLIVPMVINYNIIGIIGIGRTQGTAYSQDEVQRLTRVSGEVAIFILSDRERQMTIALRERQRLVRDLHDSISQRLYGLVSITEAARLGIKDGGADYFTTFLNRIGENARHALKEMRLFMFELTPKAVEEQGLVSVLTQRLAAVEGRSDTDYKFIVDENIPLSKEKQVALYFIAQEALNNVLKHANAKSILISLEYKRVYVVLEIVDDGIGFDTAKNVSGGMGLKNISERAKQIGAKVNLTSVPGKGTKIQVSVRADREPVTKS